MQAQNRAKRGYNTCSDIRNACVNQIEKGFASIAFIAHFSFQLNLPLSWNLLAIRLVKLRTKFE